MDIFRMAALWAALLAADAPAVAQQSIDLGSVSGRITDASGGAIAGAQVKARHTLTNVVVESTTDAEGRFRFPLLRIGPYEISAQATGFKDASRQLTLMAGSAFELPLELQIADLDATLTVPGEATLLEAARSQIVSTITAPEIQSLPMNGRNFLELALLAPGVSPTNVASTQLFPETSAVAGVTLSVGSQRNLSNNFIVDGLSANDDAAALSGMTYGVDAVEQFQVVTSGAQAELGRALGGYINVVTRSGTNAMRGTGYGYFRDDKMNSENPLFKETLPMDQAQYGGSIGGPIVANRTFYFTNAEQRRLDQTGLVTILDANVVAVNARLDASGYNGPRIATGLYSNPLDTTNLLGKIDHAVSGRDQLSVRFTLYDVAAQNARNAGGLSAATASADLESIDYALAVSNTLAFGARTVLETRAQYAHSDLQAPPSELVGPTVAIAGIATFGTSSTSPTGRVNDLFQAVNTLSHQAGAHALRGGLDFLYNDDRITFPRAFRGSYAFSSLANFLSGTYNNAGFTQTFGSNEVSQSNPNVGMFLQDEWKVHPSVTLNLGLRYDLQFLDTIVTDTNNVSPRAGIVWSPFASRRTLVRAAGGVFYDRVPLRPLANALLSAGNTTDLDRLRQVSVTLSPGQPAAPGFPNILPAAVPSGALVNFTTMDRDLDNAHSRQSSIEVEQQLGSQLTLSAGYQYLRGRGLLAAINRNAPTCIAAGGNNGCRPDPRYANNSQYSSVGDSNYHGAHLTLTQRPAAWGHYRVSYTFSKSMNNVGEFFFSSPIDPLDISKDWGRSDDDQRHRLVVSGVLQTSTGPAASPLEHLTRRLQFSASLQAYSTLPMNITSGVTTVQGTAGRPIVDGAFISRNACEGNDFFTLNLRLTRTFPLYGRAQGEVSIEGFNVTNHQNVVTRNAVFGSGAYPTNPLPSFNQVLSVAEPRSFQVGARVRF